MRYKLPKLTYICGFWLVASCCQSQKCSFFSTIVKKLVVLQQKSIQSFKTWQMELGSNEVKTSDFSIFYVSLYTPNYRHFINLARPPYCRLENEWINFSKNVAAFLTNDSTGLVLVKTSGHDRWNGRSIKVNFCP